ncbi:MULTISPECIES: YihY/virulence factor BrkB family protein [unclassified Caballeronia]|uniref:YihY/virulence factor BrkB family protein n=1 Tax=unclassified Caballeronia TaxID=2646786 RepID=UPI001F475644|nr:MULTISPECIES: YihY/virulence factor BrkB family protein [unclassified Caballeronia]MCE4547565.1 YihY/virulence factor BrkB family protein [Caballeronia sp. PC1]MCE4575024.1 YihY/virulence factor BrkB family protein [Caballeronia sp. CLC5]
MDVKSLKGRTFAWPARTFKRFSADRAAPMAASIAFYSAFSLAPTLVMMIAVAGLVFGAEAARGQLFHQISGMLGKDAAASVQAIVEHAHRSGGSGLAAVISFVLLAVGASATFSSLNTALSIIWPKSGREKSGVATLVKVRLISFGLVMGVAFLLIVSLVLDTAVQAAGKWVFGESPLVVIGDIVQFVLGLAILSCAFAALLKYLPDGHVPWRDALVGGVISAVLFSVGKKLFALYLTHAGTANAFGAAGSLAVLLMWLYFAAAVMLLGAEAAATRVEAREGEVRDGKARDGGARTSREEHTPRAAPQSVPANTRAPISHVAAPVIVSAPVVQSDCRVAPSGSSVVARVLNVVKANPSRFAIAAAGASLFVFTKGTHGHHPGKRS